MRDIGRSLVAENHLRRNRGKRLIQNTVCPVSLSGLAQGAVQLHPESLRIRVLLSVNACGFLRPHRVGAGRTASNLKNFSN